MHANVIGESQAVNRPEPLARFLRAFRAGCAVWTRFSGQLRAKRNRARWDAARRHIDPLAPANAAGTILSKDILGNDPFRIVV